MDDRKPALEDFLLFAFILGIFVLLSLFCTPKAEGANPYPAICKIDMGEWTGSGTLIAVDDNAGLILSCRHVAVRTGSQADVFWPGAGGQLTSATAYYVDPGNGFTSDISCFVTTRPKGVKPLTVTQFDDTQGPWVGLGYRGDHLRMSITGEATAKGTLIRCPVPAIGGMSGGPLLDKKGRIVGVVVGSTDDFSIAVTGKPIQDAIRIFKNGF